MKEIREKKKVIRYLKVQKVFWILYLFLYIHTPMLHVMQSYPPRALDRKLQEDWTRDAGEGPRVFMSLRVDFWPMD